MSRGRNKEDMGNRKYFMAIVGCNVRCREMVIRSIRKH